MGVKLTEAIDEHGECARARREIVVGLSTELVCHYLTNVCGRVEQEWEPSRVHELKHPNSQLRNYSPAHERENLDIADASDGARKAPYCSPDVLQDITHAAPTMKGQ